jgi:hypothetical protein
MPHLCFCWFRYLMVNYMANWELCCRNVTGSTTPSLRIIYNFNWATIS